MKKDGPASSTYRPPSAPEAAAPKSLSSNLSALVHHLVPNRKEERGVHQSRLIQAGFYGPSALPIFFFVKFSLLIGPPLLGILAGATGLVGERLGLFVGCIAGAIGMILPSFWLDRQIRRRHFVLHKALPDFLDLMTVCLEGGLSLQGALQRVGDELRMAHPVLAGELAISQREADFGLSVHVALKRLADRTGCEGMRQLSAFVRDAQRHGSELADAMRIQADAVRSQREAEAEEAAQKAVVKILIPTLLFIFPAIFVVIAGPAAIRIHESLTQPNAKVVRGAK